MSELVCKAYIAKSRVSFFKGGPLSFSVDHKWLRISENYLKTMKLNDKVRLTIEPWSEDKTSALNRFFHLLIAKWWKAGTSSAENIEALKIHCKVIYGVPVKHVRFGGEIYQFIKSWSEYTIDEACKCIDGMISEMILQGVDYDIVYTEWNDFDRA